MLIFTFPIDNYTKLCYTIYTIESEGKNMKVYVVSFVGGSYGRYEGVYSVFNSWEKAVIAIENYCKHNNEYIGDYDNDDITTWHFFTTQGTYIIERMELNEE